MPADDAIKEKPQREGSLDAPMRHAIPWRDAEFYDEESFDKEFRRVAEICHSCRRCFNLCDSFPTLFDLIDRSKNESVDDLTTADVKKVVDGCTLCDMCFMTKCPYVPPHEFNVDFPHLMLRHRAIEKKKGATKFADDQLVKTDRNGTLARPVAGLANWATARENKTVRPLINKLADIDPGAELPRFHWRTLTARAKTAREINKSAPAYGKRKLAVYATCFANYNKPEIGETALAVLAKNGVDAKVVYPACCGMPELEQGNLEKVAANAAKVSKALRPFVDDGYTVMGLVPSCSLMLKFEWPLILPEDENVKALARATMDFDEFLVDLSKKEGLAEGLRAVKGGVTLHISCHSRAQNIGQKSAELMKLIPDTEITVIERCSGHGGSWGVKKAHHETALKIGKPVAKKALDVHNSFVVSTCPLACDHIRTGIDVLEAGAAPARSWHPIEIFAKAYGL
ncbi:MAG TPA: heterodisulfide reductase-related iron-sulfur binding cluster [Parvularculaceae bacterium]|nr:heterodisulfide reductase-related iron-sulfur binding cluster [Parvularculaceae bacterium]